METFRFRKFLPFAAFLLFGSIAVLLWQNQARHDREIVFRHTETSAEQIRIRIEGMMNARMSALKLLAERWVERVPPDFSRKRFLEFAENFYGHYPGFAGINRVDREGVVQWVFPRESNERIIGTNFHEHPVPGVRNAFQASLKNVDITAAPCVETAQGEFGFETFLPMIYNGTVEGYLNGAFRVRQIIDTCLAKDIFEDFLIRLNESGHPIYLSEAPTGKEPKPDAPNASRLIHFPGKAWKLVIYPKADIYPKGARGGLLLLFFGLTVSAVLSMLLHQLIKRMLMYRQARDQALLEVSERKRTEKALKENERKLEALLAELAEKNTELETFVYTVSHDLKTPIVTIEGFIGALREDFGSLLDENGSQYLDFMSDAARKMELLINDLLHLSRIGRLPERKTEFSFDELMVKVLKAFQPQIKEKGVLVSVEKGLPLVYGEQERLTQVMENLLSNALKYIGKENPSPRIDVGAERKDGLTTFFVRDNGIGIEKPYFDKVFEIFQRLPAAKKIETGTGVGLTIVKRIIEHHGGQIWLESEVGKGTTFFFTLKKKEA